MSFEMAGLKVEDHVHSQGSLMRPSDLRYSAMDPSRINKELGWSAKTRLKEIISKMYNDILF
jgi:GDPmannose 4,6-dehydratase